MLGTRVLTACVALIFLLGMALFAPRPAFDWLLLAAVCAALYEWLKLLGVVARNSFFISLGVFAFMVMALAYWPGIADIAAGSGSTLLWFYAVAVLFWVLGVPFALSRRIALGQTNIAGRLLAVFLCCVTGMALLQADGLGKWFFLSVLLLVWVADTAAYFAGRAFGKNKLAPEISPGKTWEGVAGALAANSVLAIGLSQVGLISHSNPAGNLFFWMAMSLGLPLTLAFTLLLTLVSVSGDLYESLLKRTAGVKDSGSLLPGHGGVFDRIDALMAVFPVTMFLVTLMQSGLLGR